MSSFLCFICHSTVDFDTNDEIREKYREVVGMDLCKDSHVCHICCHILNKLWQFKAVCLKQSLEYPVLFSEKGTINLQYNELEFHTICSEDVCSQFHNRNVNSKSFQFYYNEIDDLECQEYDDNQYVKLEDDRNYDDYFQQNDVIPTTKIVQERPIDNKNSQDPNIQKNEFSDYNIDTQYLESGSKIDTQYLESDILPAKNLDTEITDNYEVASPKNYIPEGTDHDDISSEKEEELIKTKKTKKNKKKGFAKIILSLEEQKGELERRRKEKKYLEAEFKCYACALGFIFKDTYQTHMMRHEESNGEYRCVTCTLRFATPAVLRAHTAGHCERHLCAKCGNYVQPRARNTHARRCWRKQTDVAACHLCAGMFKDSSGLQQHLKRFHQMKTSNRTYMCSVCGESYNNQAAVRTHMIKHINKKFNCDQCPSKFSSPYTLSQHKKKHEVKQTELHHCELCNVSYGSKKSLLAHKRNALNHQQTIFECPICCRSCPNQRSLASHMQSVHSSTKNYACSQCPARYTNRKSLVRHIGSHKGKKEAKKAVCQMCGACFKGNNKLNRHLKEVCEKAKLEEEFAELYTQDCMNPG